MSDIISSLALALEGVNLLFLSVYYCDLQFKNKKFFISAFLIFALSLLIRLVANSSLNGLISLSQIGMVFLSLSISGIRKTRSLLILVISFLSILIVALPISLLSLNSSNYNRIPYIILIIIVSNLIAIPIKKLLLKGKVQENTGFAVKFSLIAIAIICLLIFFPWHVFPDTLTQIMIVLAVLVIALTIILLIVLSHGKKQQLFAQQDYFSQLEERQLELRRFRHDYNHLVTSMFSYITDDDLAGLKSYMEKEIAPTVDWLAHQDMELGNLEQLKVKELKSLLSVKLMEAQSRKVEMTVEIPEAIFEVSMRRVALVRVLGNFLDNAIEALDFEEEKVLHVGIFDDIEKEAVVFVVQNTFSAEDLSTKKIFEKNYTTKETGSGLGLYTVSKIIKNLNHVTLSTVVADGMFTQVLTIKKL